MEMLQSLLIYCAVILLVFIFYFAIRFFMLYKRKPYIFKVKERKEPPKCLTDPSVGNHGYLTLKEIKIHYVEKGDRTKPLMLFIHGFPEFWYSWRYQMQEFSKDFWTVAIDMRGFGDSGKPTGRKHYVFSCMVNDIKEIVDGLGRQKFILVAHDWGGAFAWTFMQKYPEMVESFIIMNAPFTPAFMEVVRTNKKQLMSSLYVLFFNLPYLPELFLSMFDFGCFKIIFRGKRKNNKTPLTVTNEDLEAFKYNFSKPGGFTPGLNLYKANLTYFMRIRPKNYNSKEKKSLSIDIPGLYLFGEYDDFLVCDHMDIAKKYVKNLKVQVVKGSNHFVQQDEPYVVNRYMREFLESFK